MAHRPLTFGYAQGQPPDTAPTTREETAGIQEIDVGHSRHGRRLYDGQPARGRAL